MRLKKAYFMKIRAFLISCFVLLHFLFPHLSSAQDINEILAKMIEANFLASYEGTLTTVLINAPLTKIYRYKIVNYGSYHRREELLTDGINKEINFDDGKYLWRFFPSKNLVIKERSRISSPIHFRIQKNFDLLKQNYEIQVIGEYNINTRSGYKLLFKPKKPDRPQQIFWIDAKSGIPFKIEKYGPDNKLVSLSSFSKIRFVVPKKKKGVFLMVPPHTKITEVKEEDNLSVEKAANLMGNQIFFPQYLPSGFTLKDIVLRFHGIKDKEKVLQFFYTDGLSAISIFQKKYRPEDNVVTSPSMVKIKLDGKEAFLSTSGTLNIVNINSHPLNITVMGDVFKEELIKVAQSLKPKSTN